MSKITHDISSLGETVAIEDPWASAFRKAGMVAPNTDEPSLQALHRETGLHPSAISRIISGRTRKPRPQTVMKIADALEVSFVEVAQWIGLPWEEFEPWTPPVESNLLTGPQRDLVEAMIKEFTRISQPNKR